MPLNDTRGGRVRAGLYLSLPKPPCRTLDRQRQWCSVEASRHGLDIVTEYADAPAHPTRFEPGLRRALADLRGGTIEALVCTDPSRLSRDSQRLQWILQQIAAARGWLVFAGSLSLAGTSPAAPETPVVRREAGLPAGMRRPAWMDDFSLLKLTADK